MNAISSTYTDLTYLKLEDLWAQPGQLTGLEYELVKFALENALTDDEEYEHEEMVKELAAVQKELSECKQIIEHDEAIINRQELMMSELQDNIDDLTEQLKELTQ
jgi:septal ring factor EnvC (AmiA/AmiB activator)